MKKKKITLDYSIDNDYYLIGICSHFSDYRLIWSLNSALDTKFFKRSEPFKVYNYKKKKEMIFPLYYYEDLIDHSTYYVIKNNFASNTLISEFPKIDYLFFVQNHFNEKLYKELLNKIKECSDVLGVFELNPSELISTQTFDLNS